MKLLESTSSIIDADKNSENVPRLENVEVVLVHCNLVNNSYQQHSKVLFTFENMLVLIVYLIRITKINQLDLKYPC